MSGTQRDGNHRDRDWLLDLSKSNLQDDDVEAVCQQKVAAHRHRQGKSEILDYQEIDVSQNSIAWRGCKVIVDVCLQCQDLRVVKLFKNELTDSAAPAVCRLVEECPELEQLHLSYNHFTEQGATDIIVAANRARAGRLTEKRDRRDRAITLWLRFEHNRIRRTSELLEDLWKKKVDLCEARNAQLCGPRVCKRCALVHLPYFSKQDAGPSEQCSEPSAPSSAAQNGPSGLATSLATDVASALSEELVVSAPEAEASQPQSASIPEVPVHAEVPPEPGATEPPEPGAENASAVEVCSEPEDDAAEEPANDAMNTPLGEGATEPEEAAASGGMPPCAEKATPPVAETRTAPVEEVTAPTQANGEPFPPLVDLEAEDDRDEDAADKHDSGNHDGLQPLPSPAEPIPQVAAEVPDSSTPSEQKPQAESSDNNALEHAQSGVPSLLAEPGTPPSPPPSQQPCLLASPVESQPEPQQQSIRQSPESSLKPAEAESEVTQAEKREDAVAAPADIVMDEPTEHQSCLLPSPRSSRSRERVSDSAVACARQEVAPTADVARRSQHRANASHSAVPRKREGGSIAAEPLDGERPSKREVVEDLREKADGETLRDRERDQRKREKKLKREKEKEREREKEKEREKERDRDKDRKKNDKKRKLSSECSGSEGRRRRRKHARETDTRDHKDVKEAKEGKEGKEPREGKEVKVAREAKDTKEAKHAKEAKEHKEFRESTKEPTREPKEVTSSSVPTVASKKLSPAVVAFKPVQVITKKIEQDRLEAAAAATKALDAKDHRHSKRSRDGKDQKDSKEPSKVVSTADTKPRKSKWDSEAKAKPVSALGDLAEMQKRLEDDRNKLRLWVIKAKQEWEERQEQARLLGQPQARGETNEQEYYIASEGEKFGPSNEYRAEVSIGKGVFSSVFKVKNLRENSEYAVKFVRSNHMMRKAADKEVEMYRRLARQVPKADNEAAQFIILLTGPETFVHQGHLAMVFDLLKCDLRTALQKYGQGRGLPLQTVAQYSRQIFLALRVLRKLKVIHGDLKPDNVLMTMGKTEVKVCDFGSAMDVAEEVNSAYLQPRYYRAPEIMIGTPYDTQIDLWSAGVTLFELATGKILFTGRTNNAMLRQMLDVCGQFPKRMATGGHYSGKHFNSDGDFLHRDPDTITGEPEVMPMRRFSKPAKGILSMVERILKEPPPNADAKTQERLYPKLADLVSKCLRLDPAERFTPEHALSAPLYKKDR